MSSKFSSVFQSKQVSEASPEQAETKTIAAKQPEAVVAKEAPAPEPAKTTEVIATEVTAREVESKPINMQPLRGKKGHPEYNQVTIYLKKETQNAAKIALLQARDERDFSELMEDLVTEWLKHKQ